MPLSHAKKRYIRRLSGYATNPAKRRVREALGREQHYEIGGAPVTLPPGHNLPFYQRRDSTYDTYASGLLATLARGQERLLVVDLGANVGDTAVTALTAAPNIDVLAVEGAPEFSSYLHRNVAPFGDRCRVVEGFVGPVGEHLTYSSHGSTGGFSSETGSSTATVTEWVTPAELLDGADSYDRVVWKSDTDGFDFHIAVDHWDDISARCDSIWLEWDPASTLGDRDDVERLGSLLAQTGHPTRVFDNLGREMVALLPGRPTEVGLRNLSAWLVEQRSGHLSVPYLDIWTCPW